MQLPKQITFQDIMAIEAGLPHSWQHLLIAILESIVAVHMTFVCLLLGKSLLDKHNHGIRLIADSSYWVYIIHFPVLFVIQFLLLDIQANMFSKFLISSLGTILVGIMSYLLLVRWTPLGWLLNGRKKHVNSNNN